ncbi:MAG: UDP-N-acetylmuramate dehydrogenase [Candidatus Abawacabacteria bacterium]|nr:UDP-N-acetylmuramate dehydrogenase [Candidatus Abawacabacteria bacterium]
MLAIKQNIPLALYSSFHIGGPAEFFVEVKNAAEAVEALDYAATNKLTTFFLGGGTNILFPDHGLSGLTIRSNINHIERNDTQLKVGSGVYTTTLAQFCLEQSLSGIEALFGLPGTIGGAIRGNAGSLGTEIKDVLQEVTIIDNKNQIVTLPAADLEFSYRESTIKHHPRFVIECTMTLTLGDPTEIKTKMDGTKKWRKEKQPGGFTAGSFFKNPPGTSAGHLIDQAGLKGFSIGDAQVSLKHANFLTNTGKATKKDVMMLAAHIKQVVLEKFGIHLIEEVNIV